MTANGSPDRAIERLARTQYGAFSRLQAISVGVTSRMLQRRIDNGTWVQLAPGVFVVGSAPPTWKRQYKAAELTHPQAAIAELAAAKLQSLTGFRTVGPEIIVPYTAKTRSPIARIHRGRDVPVTVVDGIRVTTVAQTLFDVLTRVSLVRVEHAMDAALLTGAVSIEELQERRSALEFARRPAIATWRALVDERSEEGWTPPESELESTLWDVLAMLPTQPRLVRQAGLPWWTRGEGRVDVLAPDWRLILEADGRRWHARVRDFDTDRWRDAVASSHGYRVLRFSYTHLKQRPAEVRSIIDATGRWRVDAA